MAEGGHGHSATQDSSVSSITTTVLENPASDQQTPSPNVVLKLRKASTDKKVKWEQGTVDNEHMNKKKSKCCCVYEKPRLFGESSSSDEDDHDCTNHCRNHKKKDYQQKPPDPDQPNGISP